MSKFHLANEIMENIYPVGTIYKTTQNINPSELFGGEWENLYADYEYVYTGSQVLSNEESVEIGKTEVKIMAYEEKLFARIWPDKMADYKRKWTRCIRISAEMTTGNAEAQLYLNDVLMFREQTWSGTDYRISHASYILPISDIPPKQLSNTAYTGGPGYEIKIAYASTATFRAGVFYAITAHGYYRSPDKMYIWKRIS